jgi:DNA-directed RNA polymerase subunit RPC12/RpoP
MGKVRLLCPSASLFVVKEIGEGQRGQEATLIHSCEIHHWDFQLPTCLVIGRRLQAGDEVSISVRETLESRSRLRQSAAEVAEPREAPPIGFNVKMLGFRCSRCGHEWLPRDKQMRGRDDYSPAACPKCTSPNWDKPRTVKRASEGRKAARKKTPHVEAQAVRPPLSAAGQAVFDEMIWRRKRVGVTITQTIIDEVYDVARRVPA